MDTAIIVQIALCIFFILIDFGENCIDLAF